MLDFPIQSGCDISPNHAGSCLVTPCGHYFCKECLFNWIGEDTVCPLDNTRCTSGDIIAQLHTIEATQQVQNPNFSSLNQPSAQSVLGPTPHDPLEETQNHFYVICQDNTVDPAWLECSHVYCTEHLARILQDGLSCALCRTEWTDDEMDME